MKKYAFAGASKRGLSAYAHPIMLDYGDVAQITGVYDPNWKRAEKFVEIIGGNFPVFKDFDEMITQTKPDTVIVTTVDAFHHEYLIKALRMGCDVICEKPLTVDAEKANEIIAAQKETGKKVTVIFNCRYFPFMKRIKQILKTGVIGDPVTVHFEWDLDFEHGVSYYRRWNSEMRYSQGLELHKCTHHFDLINWFLDSEPDIVFGFADRRFFGAENGNSDSKYCHTCNNHCKYYKDNKDDDYYRPFMDIDGYTQDQCIYRKEIDVPDCLSLNVKYKNGAMMTYTLNTLSPYEGFKLTIGGTKGRMECDYYHCRWNSDIHARQIRTYTYDKYGDVQIENIGETSGGHDGADDLIINDLFRGRTDGDPLNQIAGVRDGLMSIGIGIALNKSVETGMPVKVADLYKGLDD